METPRFSSVSRCAANAEFRIEFRIAIVLRLYRDRNSGFGGFHYKAWEFGNPDSGFEFRIAIVLRYDRDTEFTLCSGLACLEFDAPEVVTPFSSRRSERSREPQNGFYEEPFFPIINPPQLLDRNPPKNPLFLEGIELGKVVGKNEVLCGVGPSIAAMAEFQKLLTRHIPLFLASSEVCSFATAGVYLL